MLNAIKGKIAVTLSEVRNPVKYNSEILSLRSSSSVIRTVCGKA